MQFRPDSSDWFRPRRYVHFDLRLNDDSRGEVERYVSEPRNIERHAFFPLLAFDKPKPSVVEGPNGSRKIDRSKKRPITYAAHMDAQVMAYYSSMLSSLYERELKRSSLIEVVLAFRKLVDPEAGKPMSNIHFAHQAFAEIRRRGDCLVWAFDIKSFFDSLDPKVLKGAWAALLGQSSLPADHYKIWRFLTQAAAVNRSKANALLNPKGKAQKRRFDKICSIEEFRTLIKPHLTGRTRGIPQGTPISAALANIYLLEFDRYLSRVIHDAGGTYFRYCDDILVILPPDSKLGFTIESLVESKLSGVGLRLNGDKTERAEFFMMSGRQYCRSPLQYLGFSYDGKSVSIRPRSISMNRAKVMRAVQGALRAKNRSNSRRFDQALEPLPMFTKKLQSKFGTKGGSNFHSYALRAARIMKSEAIRRQAKKFSRFAQSEIAKHREPPVLRTARM